MSQRSREGEKVKLISRQAAEGALHSFSLKAGRAVQYRRVFSFRCACPGSPSWEVEIAVSRRVSELSYCCHDVHKKEVRTLN